MSRLRIFWPHAAMLLILLGCCSCYYGYVINKLPFGIHEWAQSDRLSLAISFYDGGMDFFHPATQNLYSERGIVGVEFPIQAYLAAAIAHLTGRDSISIVFRLLDIFIAVTGLYFLFRAVYNATRDFGLSIIAPLFIFCSPAYIFYSGNYLPDAAAASIAFIALYFLLETMRTGVFRMLLHAIAFATLAALIKTSTAAYLAGIICWGIYHPGFRTRRHLLQLSLAATASILLIAGNVAYIRYLYAQYHSIVFMSSVLPFASWAELVYFLEHYYFSSRMSEYLLPVQYPLFFLLIGFGAHAILRCRELRPYCRPLLIFFPAAIALFWLFGQQFRVHDYYFIAIFMPLTAYCLAVSLIALHRSLRDKSAVAGMRTGLLCAAAVVFSFSIHAVKLRTHPDEAQMRSYSSGWVAGGKALLRELNIPDSERIVMAHETPPNVALIYFDRRGYAIPDFWGWDSRQVGGFMDEKGARIAVMRADKCKALRAKDSAAFDELFTVLAEKGNKAVLRKK